MSETIGLGDRGPSDWICLCGNNSRPGPKPGFWPCDENGGDAWADSKDRLTRPWNGYSYVCAVCDRVIDSRTREVTGRWQPPDPSEEKRTREKRKKRRGSGVPIQSPAPQRGLLVTAIERTAGAARSAAFRVAVAILADAQRRKRHD